jgi:hypothetical protein
MSEVSNVDVAAHWDENHREHIGNSNENTLKDAAVCFFSVCQGATLGKLIVGRRGQPTRLQANQVELENFIESGPSALPQEEESAVDNTQVTSTQPGAVLHASPTATATLAGAHTPLRIFIAHGKNKTLVEQVQTMLALGSFESEVAEDEETTAIPVPEKVFFSNEAMSSRNHHCECGRV